MKPVIRFRLRWFAAAAGGLAAVLGAVVMAGWMLRVQVLVQVAPGLAVMQFNTALGLALCGAGLVAWSAGRVRAATGCGAAVAALALAVLTQYLLGIGLGIDALFVRPFLADAFSPPGRMSPSTAVAFTLSGAALAVGAVGRRRAAPLAGGLASAVVALGAFTLIGYASGLIGAQGYSRLQGMAVHTAAGFLVIGCGLFVLAWEADRSGARRMPGWLPIPVAIAGVTLTVALWLALEAHDREQFDQRVRKQALVLRSRIEESVGAQLLALVRMGQRWRVRGGTPREEWERDALLYSLHQPGLRAVAWVDAEYRVRWAVPGDAVGRMAGIRLGREDSTRRVLEQAQVRGGLTVTRALARGWPGGHMGALVPLRKEGSFDGFVLGILNVERLMQPLLEDPQMRDFRFTVSDGGEVLSGNVKGSRPPAGVAVTSGLIRVHDQIAWQLRLWASPAAIAEAGSPLPGVTLAVGLVFSLLLALSVQLGLHALRNRERVEAVNRRLQEEVAERERAEKRFRLVVEAAPNAMVITDREGRITLVNAQSLLWFGYQAEELLGRPVEVLVPERMREAHPAYRQGYVAAPATRPMGTGRELFARRKDGSEFPVDISLSPLETAEGLRVISSILDITERKRAEEALRRSNTALEAINAELEAFAYAVSHDLRQPLRGMTGFGEILLEDYGDKLDEQGRDYLRRIQAAAARMGVLIDDLLALSRITRGKLSHEPLDLSAMAHAVLGELREGEPGRVVEARVEPELEARGDPRMVRVLLTNLLSNAWKFSGRAEQARIEMGRTDNGAGEAFFVRDNGAGFDMAYADKLFGAFQRLHSPEEFPGTGIGLATVQRIVNRHGGRVWAEGEPGRGATFYFTLGKTGATMK